MTDLADHHAAVLADPFDMDRRLRYADAAAGSDPEHAELIRLQIAHDLIAVAGGTVDDTDAVDRRRRLSFRIAERFARELGPTLGGPLDNWWVRRGFPEILVMSGPDLLTHGADLAGRVPWRGVVLSGVDAAVAADLAASPLLARLAVLDLSGNRLGDDGLKALLTSPHLGRLRWLGLNRCRIDMAGVTALGMSAREILPDLRYLGFDRNAIPLTPTWGPAAGSIPETWNLPAPGYEVFRPTPGVNLQTRYGPFRWLDDRFARYGAPGYTAV